MLKPGDKAPTIEVPDADMHPINTADYLGDKNLVLYFYPKDDTPGCTIEAQDFSDLKPEFDALDTLVFGVSRDTCVSHAEFRDKYGLSIDLVADVDGQVCNAYGVWQERERNGEKRMALVRSTFIIDKQGIVRQALYDVKPKGHAEQVLELARQL